MSVWEWLNYEQPNNAIVATQFGLYTLIAILSGVGGWLLRSACESVRRRREEKGVFRK